jgi:hypothetical protein
MKDKKKPRDQRERFYGVYVDVSAARRKANRGRVSRIFRYRLSMKRA